MSTTIEAAIFGVPFDRRDAASALGAARAASTSASASAHAPRAAVHLKVDENVRFAP